jgi:hypothetical protein
MMANDKGIITGHFMAHWGVPRDIRPLRARGIAEFAVLEFAPREPRMTWRYATNGMSSYLQSYPEESMNVRTELFACTKQRAMWIDDLLLAIASYPHDFATYLAEGDTINVGQPIDQNSSCYTGILLASPEPATLGLVAGLSHDVLVHQVVGLLPTEVQFAEEHGGGKMLWQKLFNKGEQLLDEERQSIV